VRPPRPPDGGKSRAGAIKPARKAGRPQRLAQTIAGTAQHRRHQLARASRQAEFLAPAETAPPIRSGEAAVAGETALALPTPDWLHHTLTISGPEAVLAGFRAAARGPGVLPFRGEERLQEDWLHRLLAPPPELRGISVEGAKILSGRLRERVEIRAQAALDDRWAAACPLDLHALLPVPEALLRLGPGDPRVIAWLWTQWGTTWPLRHVTEEALSTAETQALPSGHAGIRTRFWSADWTPWRALAALRKGWPDITLSLAIDYGGT
jgi:hypothetical protein